MLEAEGNEPPRKLRDEKLSTTASFHSHTLPPWSNVPYALGPPLVPTVVTLPSWPFQSAALPKFA